jgi:hypothetical protein
MWDHIADGDTSTHSSVKNYMNNNQAEKSRMATLLHNPTLAKEYLNIISDDYWYIGGNKWIWEKFKSHNALFKHPPTFNILLDYAKSPASNELEKLSKAHALALMEEYVSLDPLDAEYFKSTMLAEVRDAKIKNALLTAAENKDWGMLKDALEDADRNAKQLPERVDMKTLQTKPSTDEQNLLNEWAFERQAILAIVAPTGVGKSVLTMQLSTAFSCGKSTIGFNPHRAFKVVVIQNEDSDNDIALMRDGSLFNLSDAEKEKVYANLFFVRLRGTSGKSFLNALDHYCAKYNPDIVFINPLLKYYGGDPLNTKDVSDFLNELEPILEKHNCGLILVHHTIKQSKQSRQNQVDSSYAGFGSSAWSNSVRDTVEIRSSNVEGYYKLITGKRSSKWGWKERYIKRSDTPTLPYWNEVDAEFLKTLIAAEKTNPVTLDNKNTIYHLIPSHPERSTVQQLATQSGLCDKSVRLYLKSLLSEKRIAVSSENGDLKRYYHRVDNNERN